MKSFVHDRLFPADGGRLEMRALMQEYRAWCEARGLAAVDLDRFLDEIERVCRKARIAIEVGGDQRVYCVNVALGNVPPTSAEVNAQRVHFGAPIKEMESLIVQNCRQAYAHPCRESHHAVPQEVGQRT